MAATDPRQRENLSAEARMERYLTGLSQDDREAPPTDPARPERRRRTAAPPPEDELPETPEDRAAAELEAREPEEEPGEESTEGLEEEEVLEPGEDDLSPIETVADLAKTLEMEEAALLATLHVDGRDGQKVALSDVLATYRTGEAVAPAEVQRMTSELRVRGETLDREHGQRMQELAVNLSALLDQIQTDRMTPEQLVALDETDPNSANRYRMREIERKQAVTNATVKLQAHQEQAEMADRAMRHEFRQEQAKLIPGRIPEWTDGEVAKRETGMMEEYLVGQGFQREDFAQLDDVRFLAVARDAALYNHLRKAKKLSRARVKSSPNRPLRPKARVERNVAEESTRRVTGLRERLKKSGSVQDAAALLSERLRQNRGTAS